MSTKDHVVVEDALNLVEQVSAGDGYRPGLWITKFARSGLDPCPVSTGLCGERFAVVAII
jgi:hypothetical protein